MSKLEQLPPSDSHRLVPVQSYSLHPGIVNDTWILVVEGTAPCMNMTVTLEPAVYVRQPEYWRIEAVGTVPGGFCLPATRTPYSTIAATPSALKHISPSRSHSWRMNPAYCFMTGTFLSTSRSKSALILNILRKSSSYD